MSEKMPLPEPLPPPLPTRVEPAREPFPRRKKGRNKFEDAFERLWNGGLDSIEAWNRASDTRDMLISKLLAGMDISPETLRQIKLRFAGRLKIIEFRKREKSS